MAAEVKALTDADKTEEIVRALWAGDWPRPDGVSFLPFTMAADALVIRKRILKTDNATVERFIDNLAVLALQGYEPRFPNMGQSSEGLRAAVWALAGENAPRLIAEAAWRTVSEKAK